MVGMQCLGGPNRVGIRAARGPSPAMLGKAQKEPRDRHCLWLHCVAMSPYGLSMSNLMGKCLTGCLLDTLVLSDPGPSL